VQKESCLPFGVGSHVTSLSFIFAKKKKSSQRRMIQKRKAWGPTAYVKKLAGIWHGTHRTEQRQPPRSVRLLRDASTVREESSATPFPFQAISGFSAGLLLALLFFYDFESFPPFFIGYCKTQF
jgi:hypothetical protein